MFYVTVSKKPKPYCCQLSGLVYKNMCTFFNAIMGVGGGGGYGRIAPVILPHVRLIGLI